MSERLEGHIRLIVHLVVFLALLIAWIITREDWLIGIIVGAIATLGIERAPVMKSRLQTSGE